MTRSLMTECHLTAELLVAQNTKRVMLLYNEYNYNNMFFCFSHLVAAVQANNDILIPHGDVVVTVTHCAAACAYTPSSYRET